MTKDEAKKKLKDYIQSDGGLYCLGHYISYNKGESSITLDDDFNIEELEAIVLYIKEMEKK